MKLSEIEAYLETVELPTGHIKISSYETIVDASKFVEYHISVLKRNSGKRAFLPTYDRLLMFVNHLKKKQQNENN